MEPRWLLNAVCKCVLLTGLTSCVIFGTNPTSAVEIYTPTEVIVENGTTAIFRCSFKSSEVVSSLAIVTWTFRPPGSSDIPKMIFYFTNGKQYPVDGRVREEFIGDLNKKDASIKLLKAQFNDNGTYICDVKNPPDVSGASSRTELRVVPKESLPPSNTAVIVGAVCGAVIGLILIAIVTCLIIKRHQTRHYERRTSMESVSSAPPRPQKKVQRPASSVEGSRCSSPSAPLQGPVIYAQLDHSGTKTPKFHNLERVVYADIRKN